MSKPKPDVTVLSKTPLYHGFLKVNRYRFATGMHGGGSQVIEREVMERGHAVGVLGYDPVRDEVVLVSEFRPGCYIAGDDPWTDNLVAGAIDGDESPGDAAVREMREEAGLELRDPIVVHPGAYVSSGGTSEKVALVVGIVDSSRAAGRVFGNASENEDILSVVVPRRDFVARARRAEITDFKTLLAAWWLAGNYEDLRKRYL